MKRILLYPLIFIFGTCMYLPPASFGQSVKTGARGGINSTNFNGGSGDLEPRTGFMVGGFIKMDFPLSPVSIQPEIYYSQKGAESGSDEIKLEYIEIPILVKLGLTPAGLVRPNIFAGPYAGFYFNQSSGGLLSTTGDNVEEIDYGGVVGAGIDFEAGKSIFTIDARYSFGLSPVFTSGDEKNSVFAVVAGISLPG